MRAKTSIAVHALLAALLLFGCVEVSSVHPPADAQVQTVPSEPATETPLPPALSGEWFALLGTSVLSRVNIFAEGSRLHPQNFLSFLVVGLWVYAQKRRSGESSAAILGFLFPQSIYLHPSSKMDVKVLIAHAFIVFDQIGIRILTTSAVAAAVSGALIRVTGTPTATLEGWRWAVCVFLVAAAYDFGGYWLHRISHENQVLWPFHKVHHSAEVLTPLTVARIHPMYAFFGSFFIPLTVGPVIGVITAFFGEQDQLNIVAINASYAAFDFVCGNLRHSHIWWSFGPVVSRIFSSPAMHQIHHSVANKHWNKNHAEIFSFWDWLFGTLYVPTQEEKLTFGVGLDDRGAVIQPHPTLKDALILPYLEAIAALQTLVSGKPKDAS